MLCKMKRKVLCRAQSTTGCGGREAAHRQAGSGVPERWGRTDCIRLLRYEIWALFQRRKQISNHKAKLKLYSGLIVRPLHNDCYKEKAKKCHNCLG